MVVGVGGVFVEREPVQPRRCRAVLQDIVELKEPPASVVEDAIKDDPQPSTLALGQEFIKGLVAAEEWIDMVVVVRVVAMV